LEYWLRVGVNFGIAYVPETLAHFRVHGLSTTSKNTTTKEYLKDVVDPLILAREFAQRPEFAALRRVAKSEGIDLVQAYYRDLTNELCKARGRLESGASDEVLAQLAALESAHSCVKLPPRARAALCFKLAGARARRTFDRHIGWRFASRS
jgi:hypothetical protein